MPVLRLLPCTISLLVHGVEASKGQDTLVRLVPTRRGSHRNFQVSKSGELSAVNLDLLLSMLDEVVSPPFSQDILCDTLATFHAFEEVDPSVQCSFWRGAWIAMCVMDKRDSLLFTHLDVGWPDVVAKTSENA